ncbi:cytochrome b561 and DOMON domain-containing protein at5g48750 [Phtheirospermum japonicum]|uniref:Cytochrome b561 and DOMON domain-containing protein at5g48750 n=1 Tax=Phtheirospermum japonicum TaxID=374723 RepID=A0A830BGE5_9LAMI|nr:cytochrome b561 and DOMON domain-containing protein at5g48750 [Phtheirospermum japonicum]
MASVCKFNLLLNILISISAISSALACSNNYTFSSESVFNSCIELPYLEAHLHWNYIPSLKKASIAYRAPQTSAGWIAWGINPSSEGMVGSQVLVAFRNATGRMTAYPTSITSYNPSMLPATLSFEVSNISAEYTNNEMIIYAEIGPLESGTRVNHVWQSGNSVSSGIPQIHSIAYPHLQSMGELDFESI